MTVTAKTSQAARRSSLLAPLELIFGVYAILLFLFLGLCALLVLLVVPGVQRRRRIARAAARAFLRLAAMPVTVTCDERLPATQCVIVSNHASYLDGIVFTAVLPARFGFVIKREMNGVPLAGLLLRKLGSEFVERFNRSRSAADARRVLRNVSNGNSLVFFPEGTFTKTPGLLKFHTGAFAMAVRAGCPVVPAVIRGTRRALSPLGGLPRAGRIEVTILPPLLPSSHSSDPAVELRDRARDAILGELGEPDLTCSGDIVRPPGTALG